MVEGKLDRESRTRHSCQTWMLDDVSHHVKSTERQVITRRQVKPGLTSERMDSNGSGGSRASPVDKPIPRSADARLCAWERPGEDKKGKDAFRRLCPFRDALFVGRKSFQGMVQRTELHYKACAQDHYTSSVGTWTGISLVAASRLIKSISRWSGCCDINLVTLSRPSSNNRGSPARPPPSQVLSPSLPRSHGRHYQCVQRSRFVVLELTPPLPQAFFRTPSSSRLTSRPTNTFLCVR